MDHQAMHAQLFALYDGELTGTARQRAEAHLQGCTECQALAAQWRRVAGTLFPRPPVAASEAFVDRVMRGLAAPPQRRRQPVRLSRWLWEGGWLVPAAGLAVLAVFVTGAVLQETVSVEELLFEQASPSRTVQQVFTGAHPSPEDVLGLLMEESS